MDLIHHCISLSTGIALHAAERPGEGAPVICLHGIWDEWAYFEPLIQPGPGSFEGHPVFLFDHRGHGQSDKPESGYGWSDYAADVVAFVTDRNYKHVVLAGHSLGALASLLAAAEIPDRVAALLLEDPPIPLREGTGEIFRILLELKQQPFETVVDELHAWRPFLSREQAAESARRLVQTADGVLREASERASPAIQIPKPGVTIPASTLVIQAGYEDQRAFGAEGPDLLAAVLPNLRIETVPETSHNVLREKPGEYRAIVADWWSDVSAS